MIHRQTMLEISTTRVNICIGFSSSIITKIFIKNGQLKIANPTTDKVFICALISKEEKQISAERVTHDKRVTHLGNIHGRQLKKYSTTASTIHNSQAIIDNRITEKISNKLPTPALIDKENRTTSEEKIKISKNNSNLHLQQLSKLVVYRNNLNTMDYSWQ
ncbi:hypothetical protein Tsp_08031 [Trichinella spiralis]|uniref:hypothetical protein n=1 Tax=Trichinella spiralis TaxID=6334 RepID=UPI0001EFDD4F|nr:hypothetical protein Tsp_08031 [Trichinella spiralis]